MQEIKRGAPSTVVQETYDNSMLEPHTSDEKDAQPNEMVALAFDVLELSRSMIVADNQFLAAPMGQLNLKPCALEGNIAYATDASTCYFDPELVLASFAQTGLAPNHDIIHVLVHYILLHPFVGQDIEKRSWNLAVDVAAEMLASEILGPRTGWRGEAIDQALMRLTQDFSGKLTAERLYRALKRGDYIDQQDEWEPLFCCDDHDAWYPQADDSLKTQGGSPQGQHDQGNQNASQAQKVKSQTVPQGDVSRSSMSEEDLAQQAQQAEQEGEQGSGESQGASRQKKQDELNEQVPTPRPHFSADQLEETRDKWKRAAKSMKVDLETLSRKRGEKMGGFMRELEVTQHEQIDYREFLRQFAIRNEDMRLSDDEFDYVFYTYGLELYGDMPLIEPLEYKSIKRVRDFVVVIDTSSSVTGKIVQQFIDATFDVLMSSESFFEKVNIHIIQCDTQVRSDTKITSINELDRWRKNIKLYGFGGTDFRPAFEYINKLYHSGEFDDLSGVIYFTDGWGVYPEQMPPYKVAFCFYDEDHRPELVPAWAIQLTLHPGQFESMSVYS